MSACDLVLRIACLQSSALLHYNIYEPVESVKHSQLNCNCVCVCICACTFVFSAVCFMNTPLLLDSTVGADAHEATAARK